MRIIGYCRTSTEEQQNGIQNQVATLKAEAERRGWDIEIVQEHASGKTLARRPLLTESLARLDAGEMDGLVVTKLDRLARSTLDFGSLLQRSRKRKWALISLDLGLDTSTPVGEFTANVVAAVAQMERQLIAQRTREGLSVVKARGVQLGHPTSVTREVQATAQAIRDGGKSWAQVAKELNDRGVAGPAGGKWYPANARRICLRK